MRVRVPATSANLGPGFDAFGLALSLHDEITARITGAGLDVKVRGEGAGDVPRDERHLIVRAMRAAFDLLGGPPPGIALECCNRIPHARGLGSSAAAIVGGIVLARELEQQRQGDGRRRDERPRTDEELVRAEELLPDEKVLALATEMEGHPDNVAACLYGGFTIAWIDRGAPRAVRHEVSKDIAARVFVPPEAVSTEHARKLLPAEVPHGDAAHTAGRAALLVTALAGRPELLLAATEDRLHQRYRVPAMPASFALVERLRLAGIAAVISGAGPAVLAFDTGDRSTLDKIATKSAWPIYEVGVDNEGVRRVLLI